MPDVAAAENPSRLAPPEPGLRHRLADRSPRGADTIPAGTLANARPRWRCTTSARWCSHTPTLISVRPFRTSIVRKASSGGPTITSRKWPPAARQKCARGCSKCPPDGPGAGDQSRVPEAEPGGRRGLLGMRGRLGSLASVEGADRANRPGVPEMAAFRAHLAHVALRPIPHGVGSAADT